MALLQPQERKKFWLLTAFNTFISLADIASLALLLLVVNLYANTGVSGRLLPAWMRDSHSLLPVLTCLIFFSLKNLGGYIVYKMQTAYVHRVAARISENQLVQYLNGCYADYVSVDTSVRIHRINHEPIEFAQYVLSGIQQILAELSLTLVAVAAILLYNARLFALLTVFLVPPVLLVSYLVKRKLRVVRKQVKSDSEKTTQYLQESLGAFVESNIYNKKAFFTARHSRYQRQLNSHLSALHVTHWLPSKVIEVFAVVGLFILILVNKYGGGAADIVSLGAFMAAAYKIIPCIVRMVKFAAQVRTFEYTVRDLQPVLPEANKQQAADAIDTIAFQNISFAHNDKEVLKDISLEFNKGDFADIVAPSGKGKTTLLNLLLGFLSPSSGEITVNGKRVDAAALQQYWPRIAYVKQQTFLIYDSIRNNITLEENTTNEQRLAAAIRNAGLTDFVNAQDGGLEENITDGGKNISGGQRKRIALARALYKDADVIILDEPFSELDETSERQLLEHFRQLLQQGKIVVLITHNRISESFCNKTVLLYG